MKYLSLIILMAVSIHLTAQSNKTNLSKQDYLAISKQQNKVAMITVIGGGVILTTGIIMMLSEFNASKNSNGNTGRTGEIMAYTGGGLMLIGLPFSYASERNKKKAKSMAIQLMQNPSLSNAVVINRPVIGFSLKMPL